MRLHEFIEQHARELLDFTRGRLGGGIPVGPSLVRAHGRIRVASTAAEGTTFQVTLPRTPRPTRTRARGG